MQFIIFLIVIYLVWCYRGRIYTVIVASSKSRVNVAILDYCLGLILSDLNSDERVIFRDNVDLIYRGFNRYRLGNQTVDLSQLNVFLDTVNLFNYKDVTPEAKATLQKVFGLVESAAKTAPKSYQKRDLSINEIYVFLKENI